MWSLSLDVPLRKRRGLHTQPTHGIRTLAISLRIQSSCWFLHSNSSPTHWPSLAASPNTFRDRGIWLFNPEVVLSPLREKVELIPDLQFFSGDPASPKPLASSDTEILSSLIAPTTIRTTKRRNERLLNKAERLEATESHQKFLRSLRRQLDDQIRTTELLHQKEAELIRKKEVQAKISTNRSMKRLSDDGVWRGRDAKRSIAERNAKEAIAATRKAAKNRPILGDDPTTP